MDLRDRDEGPPRPRMGPLLAVWVAFGLAACSGTASDSESSPAEDAPAEVAAPRDSTVWVELRASTSIDSLREFLTDFPGSPFADSALAGIERACLEEAIDIFSGLDRYRSAFADEADVRALVNDPESIAHLDPFFAETRAVEFSGSLLVHQAAQQVATYIQWCDGRVSVSLPITVPEARPEVGVGGRSIGRDSPFPIASVSAQARDLIDRVTVRQGPTTGFELISEPLWGIPNERIFGEGRSDARIPVATYSMYRFIGEVVDFFPGLRVQSSDDRPLMFILLPDGRLGYARGEGSVQSPGGDSIDFPPS